MMDNAAVVNVMRARSMAAVLLSFAIAGSLALPREHAHPGDASHHPGAIHRHFEGHAAASTQPAFDHDEVAPVWLLPAIGTPATTQRVIPSAVAVILTPAAPFRFFVVRGIPVADGNSIHDPPPGHAFGLRAPPASRI